MYIQFSIVTLITLFASVVTAPVVQAVPNYPWLVQQSHIYNATDSIEKRIPLPEGYKRVPVQPGSFQEWLRGLPLLKGKPPVMLYNGQLREGQDSHHAVVNLDIGTRNLQQCADAIMRLRAEYLFSQQRLESIHFNFTSGERVDFIRWAKGERPVVHKNRTTWRREGIQDSSYRSLRDYLETVYQYAGTYSLSREQPVDDPQKLQIGDIFIQGGFPGHCVIVVDVAVHENTGERFSAGAGIYPARVYTC